MSNFLQKPCEIEGLPGKDHPDRWPEGLDKMIERLSKFEFLGLYHEEYRLYKELLSKLSTFVEKNISKLAEGKPEPKAAVESIKKGTTALLLFGLAFGDFSFWVRYH